VQPIVPFEEVAEACKTIDEHPEQCIKLGVRHPGETSVEHRFDPGFITAPASGADIEVERYVGNFRVACQAVADRGITLAFEFLGKLRVACNLATGLKIVEEVGLPNAGLLIDTAHFLAGGSSMEDLRNTPVERIALIHFEDMAAGSRDTAGEKDRRIPGEGAAPLREFVRILHSKGYDGYYSMEPIGASYGEPVEVARRGYQGTRRLLEEAEG